MEALLVLCIFVFDLVCIRKNEEIRKAPLFLSINVQCKLFRLGTKTKPTIAVYVKNGVNTKYSIKKENSRIKNGRGGGVSEGKGKKKG